MRGLGMPLRRHCDTAPGSMSKMFATTDVPPKLSMSWQASRLRECGSMPTNLSQLKFKSQVNSNFFV